jgi:hypothetical protein
MEKLRTKADFWLMVAVLWFVIAAGRFYSTGDVLGASVFAMVALVFVVRMWIQRRRRMQ